MNMMIILEIKWIKKNNLKKIKITIINNFTKTNIYAAVLNLRGIRTKIFRNKIKLYTGIF